MYSQKKFTFFGKNKIKQELSFKLVNNLIVFPLEINGHKLSFILDTGVNKTILFNLTQNDSVGLNNVDKVFIKGLGTGAPVEALLSKGNDFRIKNIYSTSQQLYVILKDSFNLSAKMGVTIHGIIGYSLLKDLIVKINYRTQKLTFYNPSFFKEYKCRKCEVFPLQFYRNKPYLNVLARIDSINNVNTPVKLLIDTGGSDALWLFENSKEDIKTPIRYFKDILGEGLSGTIYGNRSKIPSLTLAKFTIEKPTVSFLDSSSTFNARRFKDRNGSIGGDILKRFKVWIDYPNKKITLKKTSSINNGFYYNMSGLQIEYEGRELVKIEALNREYQSNYVRNQKGNNVISFLKTYQYKFKPKYKISEVVIGSPAHKVGLLKGDIIKSINGKAAYVYDLNEIMFMFRSKPGKKIVLKIKRGITDLKFEFKLKKRI